MSNITIIPESFKNQRAFNLIELDDFSGVIFRQRQEHLKKEVYTTCHIFVVVLYGEKIIHTQEGEFHIKAGNAFLARRGLHLFSEVFAGINKYESLIFFIDDLLLERFFRNYSVNILGSTEREKHKNIFQISISPLMRVCIDATIPFFSNKSDVSKELLRVKLTEILLHIAQSEQGAEFLSFAKLLQSKNKKDLIPLMEDNFSKSFSIESFAHLSGRSLTTFKKDFKNIFHQTPKKWITRKRLGLAHFLLLNSDLNVTDTCFEVGFENISYFGQLFKKEFGVSPKKIQKDLNQEK